MGFWNVAEKVAKHIGNAAKANTVNAKERLYQKNKNAVIGGKSISQWEGCWKPIGILSNANFTPYNKSVGLYRAKLGGRVVYIGRALESSNGGFRKRLSDYRRKSDSARKHGSGQKMNLHNDQLQIDILVTGGNESAADVAKKLEVLLVGKYKPEWNKQLV
ncbi:MAG: hypothetical protein QNK26_17605 [Moritella sp.]|uniref:hypothetical protein n=1 Tax=Moritella sp. TaxID=78556 RepID=UPI0029A1BFA3|nr:hypothetical protein [Moritella sp.]MDX2322404.1 hypothetical protein [Moritella sp.]